MRGKVRSEAPFSSRARITPAYAGKSVFRVRLLLVTEDHPRLCGEKSFFSSSVFIFLGSPPPMRGKACVRGGLLLKNGITPAYAGKSHNKRHPEKGGRDHPRLCGEKFSIHAFSFSSMGSPPPMRGKVYDWDIKTLADGITPAYAGKSA